MSGLIWIQTVRYSDCIPEIFFFVKVDFETNQQTTKSRKKFEWKESKILVSAISTKLSSSGFSNDFNYDSNITIM